MDGEYDGSDFMVDQELRNGPLYNRKCTDVICLILFIAFLAVYGATCVYSIKEGKPEHLLRPVNGDGDLCGHDSLIDYPNLYYIFLKG